MPSTLVALFATLALASSAIADEPPEVLPGGSLAFPSPDAPPSGSSTVKWGAICQTGGANGMLGSLLVMPAVKSEAECEIEQHNDFSIEGQYFDSLLRTRISGTFSVAGFLELVGLGQVRMKVVADVIDLGDDLQDDLDDHVVTSQTLATYELVEGFEPSIGGGIAFDLGSATVAQVGADADFSFRLPLNLRVIRDDSNFGFEMLLRRGRTYRLKVYTTSRAKLSVGGGFAVAGFLSPDGIIGALDPDTLFDPKMWLQTSGLPIKDLTIPDLQLGGLQLFTFPEIAFDPPSVSPPLIDPIDPPKFTLLPATPVTVPPSFPSVHQALAALGLPPDIANLLLTQFLGFGKTFAKEEGILGQGVGITNLSLRIQEDAREQARRLLIEQNLARQSEKKPLAAFQLPVQFGGFLELVHDITKETIDLMLAAGEDVGPAPKHLKFGEEAYAKGKFKAAYEEYRLAYAFATSG